MKNTITTLVATALFAALSTSGHAATQTINQGRAGYSVRTVTPSQSMTQTNRHMTTVALVMEKPQPSANRIQNGGRAGYVAVPNSGR